MSEGTTTPRAIAVAALMAGHDLVSARLGATKAPEVLAWLRQAERALTVLGLPWQV